MARAARSGRAHGRRGRRRWPVLVAVVTALVVASAGVAWAMSTDSGANYRLATVSTATVAQTVTSVGTISSANRVTLSFPVGGQVSSVGVVLGSQVKAGQTLATLDTSALDQQVHSAQATVAAAQQSLAADQQSQLSGTSSSTSSPSTSGGLSADDATARSLSTPSRPSSGGAQARKPVDKSLAGAIADVTAKQRAVIADQHTVDLDTDVANADHAIVAENAACQAILSAPTDPNHGSTPAAGSSSASAAPTATPAPPSSDLQSCQDAIAVVQNAQKKVQSDEDTVAADEAALDQAVSVLLTALKSSGAGSSSGTGTPGSTGAGGGAGSRTGSGSSGSSGSGSTSTGSGSQTGSGGRSSTTVITAAQLVADQKQIDAATANLRVAGQNLAQAKLSTPIAGVVAAVSLVAGDSVAAASGSKTITVVGAGQKQLATTIGISAIDLVKQGQKAQVTVNGVSGALPGVVRLIGVMNTSGTSGSTATYPVTIVLDPSTVNVYDGAGASVAIEVGTASNVLTVPTSALHKLGRTATVTVDKDGKLSTVIVRLGIEGMERTQIVSGLRAGQRVVLAEISAPIPTNPAGNARRFGGGAPAGGFGGRGG